jgi:hypothetical protein
LEAARSPAATGPRGGGLPESEELVDYCSRPRCRKEFRRASRGRRQEYCSEICRRTAEKELRQARARLAHFEGVVDKLRVDVAAFGRSDNVDGAVATDPTTGTWQVAENAVRRASGALVFAASDEPAVRELRALYEAVAPVVLVRGDVV